MANPPTPRDAGAKSSSARPCELGFRIYGGAGSCEGWKWSPRRCWALLKATKARHGAPPASCRPRCRSACIPQSFPGKAPCWGLPHTPPSRAGQRAIYRAFTLHSNVAVLRKRDFSFLRNEKFRKTLWLKPRDGIFQVVRGRLACQAPARPGSYAATSCPSSTLPKSAFIAYKALMRGNVPHGTMATPVVGSKTRAGAPAAALL